MNNILSKNNEKTAIVDSLIKDGVTLIEKLDTPQSDAESNYNKILLTVMFRLLNFIKNNHDKISIKNIQNATDEIEKLLQTFIKNNITPHKDAIALLYKILDLVNDMILYLEFNLETKCINEIK